MATVEAKTKPKAARAARRPKEDREHLAAFNKRRELLKLRVKAVATGRQNGLVVYGPPGVGKTKTVRETLDRHGNYYDLRNACSTARGLYEMIVENISNIIVLDDQHSLLTDKGSMQILLAALGGELGKPRLVTYTKSSSTESDRVHFSGGIIAISNLPIPSTPLGHALASRVCCIDFNPTPEQMAAALRDFARKPHRDHPRSMTPAECRRVVDFVLEHGQAENIPVDFRTVTIAYGDYLTCYGQKQIEWQELVLDHLRSKARPARSVPNTKKDKLDEERQQLLEAQAANPEMSVPALAKHCGIKRSKAYELLKRTPK